ncbi:MAG: glycoside hydrolase family 30 beta sandwich domain-containing protein [Bacteroidota bacterium]
MRLILRMLFFSFMMVSLLANCGEDEDPDFMPPKVDEPDGEVPDVQSFVTTADRSSAFNTQGGLVSAFDEDNALQININAATRFQPMDGIGFALTGGSADHISAMSDAARTSLLNELFGNGEGQIGASFIRISIGSSDLDPFVFFYNEDATDTEHKKFSLERDQRSLLPVLKEIIAIRPSINIMASPWSAPSWMKSNNASVGGELLPEFYDSYAQYLAEYVKAMEREGVTIGYLTIQNEPLNGFNNPSMMMSAADQASFIKDHLGPTFEREQIAAKLIIYDHNPDRPDYPIEVLNDTEAAQYVDGSAFHLYAGEINALSTVQNAHPDKAIYFTEQWFGAPGNFAEDLKWHTREVVVGSISNWSRAVIEWNLSSNPTLDPHTPGGCEDCLGCITIDGDRVTRNAGYYVVAHASKFVQPGAERVQSNYLNELPNVAFVTPEGEMVLLVLNNTATDQRFNVSAGETQFSVALSAGAVTTLVWDLTN